MRKGMDRKSPLGRAYHIWCQMRYRCRSVPKYAGVTVCQRWFVFEDFVSDMGLPSEGQSIDRIDGNKGYEPSNCRWADITIQNRNRKCVKLSDSSVNQIKQLAKQGVLQKDIAVEFNVSSSAVSLVLSNKIWRSSNVMGRT